MRMIGVGILCLNAHCRASLLCSITKCNIPLKQKLNLIFLRSYVRPANQWYGLEEPFSKLTTSFPDTLLHDTKYTH